MSPRSPSVAEALGPVVERAAQGALRQRRFAIRFWDGSELAATGETDFRILVRGPDALAHLVREPGQLGLGRAWVSGQLALEGDLEPALASLRTQVDGARLSHRDRLAIAHAAWRVGALRARRPPIPASEAHVHGRRHSLRRDSAAVRHHYDVPTDFYQIVLGPTLVYSCAYFSSPRDTLEHAQERKLDVICRKLRLREGERFLDVGCGWGSLILHAARRYGVRAVGITLSPSQAEEAQRRIEQAGMAGRCEVRVVDYRELDDGPYDKLASVGMYEHVGRAELPRYVTRLSELVRPGGLVLNHGIARLGRDPKDPKSFIANYVFPDGELHPVGALVGAMEELSMEVRDVESLREHYALTLRRWVDNLASGREEAVALAGAERERIWRLYMTGAAQAFERGELGLYQTLAARPGAPHRLPLARGDTAAAGVTARSPAFDRVPTAGAPTPARRRPARPAQPRR